MLETTKVAERLVARQSGPDGFHRLVTLKHFFATAPDREPSAPTREAHAYALLSHPGVLRLYQFLLLSEGPTLVLEHVDGLSLAELRARGPMLDDAIAGAIAHTLFGVLAAAHDARNPETAEFCPLVHGGLSPASVQIAWTGDVKLGDFRMPPPGGASIPPPSRDLAEDLYAAPEQVRGEQPTVRTDVFRACAIAFELFARPSYLEPIAAVDPARVQRSLAHDRPDLPRLVADAITRGLEPSAERRNVSAAEILAEIDAALPIARGQRELAERMKEMRRQTARGDDPTSFEPTLVVHRDVLAALDSRTPEETTAIVDRTALPLDLAISGAPDRPTVKHLPIDMEGDPTERGTSPVATPMPKTSWPVAMDSAQSAPSSASGKIYAIAGAVVLATGGLAVAVSLGSSTEPTRASAASRADTAAAVAPHASESAHRVENEATDAAAGTGDLETPPTASEHRVFVDGIVVGSGGARITIPCGAHFVRVGSNAPEQRVDVPCGGVVTVPLR